MARQSGQNQYFLARKGPKLYMRNILDVSVQSITTAREQHLYLDGDDAARMRGRKILVVDDVISTGESLTAIERLVEAAGGEVAGVGVAIEKAMRDGGRVLRRMGIRVEALATVERIEGDRIILKD